VNVCVCVDLMRLVLSLTKHNGQRVSACVCLFEGLHDIERETRGRPNTTFNPICRLTCCRRHIAEITHRVHLRELSCDKVGGEAT
jgi:hypothetical protein